MTTCIRPFMPLHTAVDDVLTAAADFVVATHQRSPADMSRAFSALEAAVDAHARAQAAQRTSLDSSGIPCLAVICGGAQS